ncbi:hypothetical protein FVEN_g5609 [Fusarium venenatum]|uniref:Uncharacterized protein n=2 Tax=Fusarium venenatum TaxID=56646 RepID=A0A2L2TR07_9HYPO|nr:uncharacterized protein FVRRES_04019 [Fusarium venenatum]KAG8356474.1 hypothetical protein FVEN_g5609 [Fusarium venenatum]CEI67507.1 unnamed protein product [Fusarium venenatum]
MAFPSSAGTFRLDFIVAEEPAGHDNNFEVNVNFTTNRHHGPNQCSERCVDNHQQCGEGRQAPGPSSKVVIKFLGLMQAQGFIGEIEEVDDRRSGKIVVQLNGRLNKCGVISPHFNVRLGEIEKWVVPLLPAPSVRAHCPHHLFRHHGS